MRRRRVLRRAAAAVAALAMALGVAVAPVSAAGEPTAITTAPGNGSLTVSWTAPSDVTPVSYKVRHREKGTEDWTTSDSIDHPTVTYTISSLTNGTEYDIEVQTASPGPSSWASTTATPGVPLAPTAPELGSGDKEIAASWTAPANNGSAIVDYEVEHRSVNISTWTRHYNGGSVSGLSVEEGETSDGPNGDPIDLGNISGLNVTLTRESIGANDGIYRLGSAVDGIWMAQRFFFDSAAVVQTRSAATKPTATTLLTHGTQIWRTLTRPQAGNPAVRIGTTPALAAGTYIWFVTEDVETLTTQTNVELKVDLANATTVETVAGLKNGDVYRIRVRARNAHGAGAWSPDTRIRAGLPATPAAPELTSGNMSLSVEWTAAAGRGAVVTDYDVRYCPGNCGTGPKNNTNWTEWLPANNSSTLSATITGLTNGASYQVQVRAQSSRGEGAWSPSATLAPGLPGETTPPQLTVDNQSLDVTWGPPTVLHGAAVTDYDVRYSSDSGATWTEWNPSNTSTEPRATITGLVNGTTYRVQVRATTTNGVGPWSSPANAAPAAQPPDAPAKPTVTFPLIWWFAPSANGAAITDYNLRWSSDSGTTWTELVRSRSAAAHSSLARKLPGGQSYIMQARAVNSVGTSDWSPSTDSFMAPARAPAKPAAPTVTPRGTSLDVSWTAPHNNGAAITDYDVSYVRFGKANWVEWNAADNSTSTTATIASLEANVTYQVRVRAANTHGDGLWSEPTDSRPDAKAKPDAPAAPLLATGSAQISVSWTAPLDNRSAITDYDVQYSSDGGTTWTEWSPGTSTALSATITGLTNGTTYQVQARATNAIGVGDWSPSSSATAGAPLAPAKPVLTRGDTALSVSWSAPSSDNGSAVTDYDVRYSSDAGAAWTEWNAADTSTATTATVEGLANNTAYLVQVRAANTHGNSLWSASARATPRANTAAAPGVPGNITAVRTAGSAAVSWVSPGAPYLKYQLVYREVAGDTFDPNPSYPASGWTSVLGTTSATSDTITAWDDAKSYVAAARARSQVTGRYGDWGISGLLVPAGTPPRVDSVKVAAFGQTHIDVRWKIHAGYTHTNYEVSYSENTSPRSWSTAQNPFSCGTICTRSFQLDMSKSWVARVRTVATGNKTSQWVVSAPWQKLDIEDLSSSRVLSGTDPSYVELRPRDVVVTWDELPGGANVSYRVRLYHRAGDPASYYDANDNNSTAGAKPDNWNMDWQWYSLCNDGNTSTNPPGSRGCADPFEGTTPYLKPVWWFGSPTWGAPQTVTASACTNGTCSHTFTDSTVVGLSTKVQVWAVDSSNKIGPRATHTTHPARPPFPPLWAKAVAPSGASVQVQWLEGYDNGSPITGFDVRLFRYNETTNLWEVEQEAVRTKGTPLPDANRDPRDSPVLTYTFHGVTTSRRYYTAVRSHNIEGTSNWRVMRTSLTLRPTKPPPPAPPSVSIAGTTATVTWMAPADDGGSAVTGYLVQYRKVGADDLWPDAWSSHTYSGAVCSGSTACSTTVTVAAGSTVSDYQFRVAATNSITAGSDQYSSVGDPDAPTSVTASAVAGGVSVAWTQPADIGDTAILAAEIRIRTSAAPKGTWSPAQTPAANPAASPTVITGLTASTAYDVQMRIRNANGASPWVDAGTVTPS